MNTALDLFAYNCEMPYEMWHQPDGSITINFHWCEGIFQSP